MTKRSRLNVAAAIVLAAGSAVCADVAAGLSDAANELLRMYPGAAIHQDQGRVRIIYGMPMTPGLDARAAANSFIQMHGQAFGCGVLAMQEDWAADFGDGSKTVLCYQQYLAGLPVEYGCLKVMVLNGPVPRVVYAAGTLAPMPGDGGFPEERIDGAAAVNLVRAMPVWKKLPNWSAPQKVVFQGNGDWTAPVIAWKFIGESPNPSEKTRKTFFVDAATGRLVHIRDEVVYSDVAGSIRAMATPGTLPDVSYNAPTLINVPDMRAAISGGNSAFTDSGGLFSIINPGTSPVTVSCGVNGSGAGHWVNVVPQTSSPITASLAGVTPPGPANLVLNASPSELLTAQANGFIVTTLTHNYFKGFAPTYTRLDTAIPCNTAVSGTCNAFFDGASINFYNAGGGCVNTTFSTVVSHEYGHFIVSTLGPTGSGLPQNAFGEGYGDTNGEMIWNDRITGRDWQGPGTFVRDPYGANIQYPCSGEIHYCGQVIGGTWWGIRLNMGTAYGEPLGLDKTRQLEVNWSLITTGGPNSVDSAGPGTAIEVLTADDDDGNLANGTPNYYRVCPAFASHNIQCPVVQLLGFQYPSGRPAQITPAVPTNIPVNVVGLSGTPQPGTGVLTYRINGGSFTTIPMTQGATNQYTAILPPVPCGQAIDYYVGAQATGSSTVIHDPPDAPSSLFSAVALAGVAPTTVADLNFQVDPGWSVINDPSLATGAWERAIPAGPAPTAPTADYDGSGQAWVTDNRTGTGTGAYDVDGGPTTLTTSAYNLSGFARATVSYARWYTNSGGVLDNMVVQMSGDNGANWTTLETVSNSTGWLLKSFNVPTLTSQVRFRWVVSDNPNDSVTEAGLDAFKLIGYICTTPTCYANCDASTTAPILNVNDFICFLNRFAASDSYANCDASTIPPVLNVLDFTCFLNAFAAGCG